jgi:hypothetical protein
MAPELDPRADDHEVETGRGREVYRLAGIGDDHGERTLSQPTGDALRDLSGLAMTARIDDERSLHTRP